MIPSASVDLSTKDENRECAAGIEPSHSAAAKTVRAALEALENAYKIGDSQAAGNSAIQNQHSGS